MRSIALIFSLAFLFSPVASAPALAANSSAPQLTGGKDIVIKKVRIIVPSANQGVSAAGGTQSWYIVTFTFTNTSAYPMIPVLNRFIWTDGGGTTMAGQVTGDPDLIGNVNNPHANDVLKPGDTYEYTIGFLISSNQPGFIYYDRTGG